jgi:cell division protein ZapA|tara:strand:- start:157 stop:528 length:372 start_codon:yes stop_codon:yes gene_type:complete
MSKDSDEIISIKVAGVEYQLHCPKDEQRGLLNAADYLNKKVRKIKRQAKFLSMEKASVLAGLEVANELLNSDKVEISEPNEQEDTSEQKIVENQEVRTDEQNTNKTEDLSIKLVSEISELSKL